MKRFLVFPLVLGFCGTFFLTYCFAQFAIVVTLGVTVAVSSANPRLSSMQDEIIEQTSTIFLSSYIAGAIFGIIMGLSLAIWDKIRNLSMDGIPKILPNIFYCLLYALILTLPNHVLGLLYLYGYTTIKFFGVLPLIAILLLNSTAILWAAIRSIQTDDVLTPRVLLAKMRQRSRLN